jgi:hypothetical protein
MPLSVEDINDIKSGMKEIYGEVYSSSIQYLPYDTINNTKDDDVYEERKYKKFLTAITLVGKVSIDTSEEQAKPTGGFRKYDATFTIPTLALEEGHILELGEDLIMKGHLMYKDIEYDIKEFNPESNVSDLYLKYVFKCKKVQS